MGVALGFFLWYGGFCRGVAQWLARYVRDVEAGGSNPLTPTIGLPVAPFLCGGEGLPFGGKGFFVL